MSSSQEIGFDYWIQEKLADNRIQKYCDKIRNDIEGRMNRKLEDFIAKHYVVKVLFGGTTYIVKIHDSDHVYVHVKFCVGLTRDGDTFSFEEFQDNKKEDELIIPF